MFDVLDTKLLLYIQDRRNFFLNPIMIFVTNFGNAVWFILGFCLWLGGIVPVAGKFILITLFASWGLTSLVLKPLIGRKRAYYQIPGLVAIIPEPQADVSSQGTYMLPKTPSMKGRRAELLWVQITM